MKKLLVTLLSSLLIFSCSSNKKIDNKNNSKIRGDSNILVAYFSVTNNTEKLALFASEHLKADVFEIEPEEPYTSQDIDYNSDCRANKEQNDPTSRPKIKNKIEDISKYDSIVLGYPIWWGQAPKIMYSFVESYDLSGKTILPFCTSGSSPIGSSATNLAKSTENANWLEGKRFSSSTSKDEINSWLDNYFKVENDMKLFIDSKEINVTWEDNASVKALKETLSITINMHEYGGFEQTGSIGQSIVRNDSQIDTSPGDIVLYQGNQISVFYNFSSWSYTRLGHINLTNSELNTLLNKSSIVFELK